MTGKLMQINDQIQISYNTYGSAVHPALLLIMGACCQKIFWTDAFCKKMADLGLFVIRYDHRDVGKSSAIDFNKHPYDTNDMVDDAFALLKALHVTQAHVLGLSLGGTLAQLLHKKAPKIIQSLVLVSASCDYYPLFNALKGANFSSSLPPPTKEYLNLMNTVMQKPSEEEMLAYRIKFFELMRTPKAFNPKLEANLQKRFMQRQKANPYGLFNHLDAELQCLEIINEAPNQVTIPTTIIQGQHDCIFPVKHGEYLHQKIPGSDLLIIKDMGHVPGEKHEPVLVDAVSRNLALSNHHSPVTCC